MLPHAGPCGDHPGARGRGAPLSQRIARFLYTTPLAGPRCTFLGLHRVGDTVVTKSFLCVAFCALRAAHTMPTNLFLCRRFSTFPARQGAFPGWTCPFPPVQGEGPSPGLHRPLRACVRELSTMSRNTTSKAKSPKPDFFRWGEPIWAGKRKTTSHFFHPKIGGILRGRRATRRFFPGRTRELLAAPSLFRL